MQTYDWILVKTGDPNYIIVLAALSGVDDYD